MLPKHFLIFVEVAESGLPCPPRRGLAQTDRLLAVPTYSFVRSAQVVAGFFPQNSWRTGFSPAWLRKIFGRPIPMGRSCFKNMGRKLMTDVDCQFDHALLARILIPWVGSLSGWIEDVGLTRMVINGNW